MPASNRPEPYGERPLLGMLRRLIFAGDPLDRGRTFGPFGWRIPVAIIILALLVAPGAVAILAAGSRYTNLVGAGLVLSAVLAGLGLLVFLAVVHVVAYVVSAAWHDAQNARLPR